MNINLEIVLFFIGFYILIKGANFLVDGSSSLARKLNISSIVIGLVITGIGTSIPEFAITFISNLTNKSDISLGTIIGSNTFNILFILGISALLFPLPIKKIWVKRDIVWNMIAVFIVAFLVIINNYQISRIESLLMLTIFSIWLYFVIKKESHETEAQQEWKMIALPIALFMILGGLIGVIVGGNWVVDGAVAIAQKLNISNSLISLTIVSIGTSLPELAVSLVAAYKKRPGLALGNIIGSNIFDFLMILGFASFIKPISFSNHLFIDILITLLSCVLLFVSMFIGKEKYTLKRWQGFIFVLFYILYLIFIINRG